MDENFPDPGGHFVGLWCSEMNVEHEDRHTDAEMEAKLYEYTLYFIREYDSQQLKINKK